MPSFCSVSVFRGLTQMWTLFMSASWFMWFIKFSIYTPGRSQHRDCAPWCSFCHKLQRSLIPNSLSVIRLFSLLILGNAFLGGVSSEGSMSMFIGSPICNILRITKIFIMVKTERRILFLDVRLNIRKSLTYLVTEIVIDLS